MSGFRECDVGDMPSKGRLRSSPIVRYLVQAGTGSGTGFTPALQFHIIEPHKQVNIAGIVSRIETLKSGVSRH
jgi:hypothetical protein